MSRRIAWYLRDARNLHYFAVMRPFLERFMEQAPGCSNHLVVTTSAKEMGHDDYRDFAHLFAVGESLDDFDLVVTPSYLRPNEHPAATPAVQIFHGISDKPFTVERDFSRYALALCIGQRQVDRLYAYPHNQTLAHKLVGFAKFDSPFQPMPLFPGRRKPVLVYAPTWAKGGFSSINRFLVSGVVESLVERFDVVIKPHPNIFNPDRPFYDQAVVDQLAILNTHEAVSVVHAGNVLGYFAAADVCVADISSAGYEWLWFNRPMVFLNPDPLHFRASRDVQSPTYLWQAGDVCNDPGTLASTVSTALNHDKYATIREQLLSYNIYLPHSRGAAVRGANAIQGVLDGCA